MHPHTECDRIGCHAHASRVTRDAPKRATGSRGHASAPLTLLCLTLVLPACTKRAGPLFPPPNPSIVWPSPPDPARIRYVGQLALASDLKPPVPFGQALATALFGKHADQSMLTPFGVTTDGRNRLFVADSNAQLVHVWHLDTRKYERWTPSKNTRFNQPVALTFDPASQRLYVADSVASQIYVLDATGKLITTLGAGFLKRPTGLALDPTRNRIFVADPQAHAIAILPLNPDPATNPAWLGQRGTELGQFNFPTSLTLSPDGMLYVCDTLNWRVQVFGPDLKPLRQIGRKGDMPGYFSQPKSLALDTQGHLYVVDSHFESVQIFDPNTGELLLTFGEEGHAPGQFWLPTSIHIDPQNRIWIADSYNRRIQVFDYLPLPPGGGALLPLPPGEGRTEGRPGELRSPASASSGGHQ
jgi:DNA-binding beta-propeller fold protein YncE